MESGSAYCDLELATRKREEEEEKEEKEKEKEKEVALLWIQANCAKQGNSAKDFNVNFFKPWSALFQVNFKHARKEDW
eukprot:s425_g2.t1